jgi:hypothetical protein
MKADMKSLMMALLMKCVSGLLKMKCVLTVFLTAPDAAFKVTKKR